MSMIIPALSNCKHNPQALWQEKWERFVTIITELNSNSGYRYRFGYYSLSHDSIQVAQLVGNFWLAHVQCEWREDYPESIIISLDVENEMKWGPATRDYVRKAQREVLERIQPVLDGLPANMFETRKKGNTSHHLITQVIPFCKDSDESIFLASERTVTFAGIFLPETYRVLREWTRKNDVVLESIGDIDSYTD